MSKSPLWSIGGASFSASRGASHAAYASAFDHWQFSLHRGSSATREKEWTAGVLGVGLSTVRAITLGKPSGPSPWDLGRLFGRIVSLARRIKMKGSGTGFAGSTAPRHKASSQKKMVTR